VWLPRLRRPHKDRAYLLRFARKFMSDVESEAFLIQNEARYPAPGRRVYDTQAYQQQQQYYGNRGYAPAPQGYYYQPRQQYYQPRGLFSSQN